MGFSNVNAQLLTVPVYVWGASVFMFVAWFSDKYRMRSPFIVLGLSLNLLGKCHFHVIGDSLTPRLHPACDHRVCCWAIHRALCHLGRDLHHTRAQRHVDR